MDIKRICCLAESILKDYREQLNGTRRWLQDYRKEVQAFKEYRGREVFELLQNADDACSDTVELIADSKANTLTVKNSGSDTKLFDEEGIQSIMLSDMSPKKGTQMIGAKGLGFRSVLNWTDRVEIRSDNVSLKFGEDIVRNVWEQLKSDVHDAGKYEFEAVKDGRCVPLAVLSLPEIQQITPDKLRSTSVILTYDPAVEQSILDNLKSFRPEVLLFLKHVRKVSISIDGKKLSEYTNDFISENDGIRKYALNQTEWVMSINQAHADNGMVYEAACAFCINNPDSSYEIYSHFPTKVFFPFPCILHATLELDSSRNSLLPANQTNRDMMSHLAVHIRKVAEYLKTCRHDWFPYMLMRPDRSQDHKNEYIRLLLDILLEISAEAEYVPTLDGKYAADHGYYHYSDELYHFLKQDPYAKVVFPALRMPDSPVDYLCGRDPDAVLHMEKYSSYLAGNHELHRLADLVSLLLGCSQYHNLEFNILPDEKFNIINVHHEESADGEDKAYINTGLVVNDIPDFKKIRYVNKDFVAIMEDILQIASEHKERELVDKLNSVTNVIATDITAITYKLLPGQTDKDLSTDQKEALIACLFNHYIENVHGSSNITVNRNRATPYLMSEAGEWVDAKCLVFQDPRFPSGKKLKELNINYKYDQKDGVLFPEFLEKITGSTPDLIEDFYAYLGVSSYFRRVDMLYGDDKDYILQLKGYLDHTLYEQVAADCSSCRVGAGYNIDEVAEDAFFAGLSLNDALSVICTSNYIDKVCGSQRVMWFKGKRHSVEVGLSYAAYRLKQIDALKQLQYYVIDEDTWLPGHEPSEKLLIGKEYRHKELLRALGAKRTMSEFSVDELYEAVNNLADRFELGEIAQEHIVEYYISLIQALDAKRNEITGIKSPLRLICRKGADLVVMDAGEVYYSDNNDLPADLIRTLPMLLMRRRQGEKKIQTVLGCRTFKDLDIQIKDKRINEQLTKELNRHIEARKAYFLAFASAGVGRRGGASSFLYNDQYKSDISSFALTAASMIVCQYGSMADPVQVEQEGELLCAKEFFIFSDCLLLRDAMANPRFNSSVVEALCIKLKLTGSEMSDRFYRIFTSDEKSLQYYRLQEIDDQLWRECEPLFDYTEEELCFWEKVFLKNGKNFSREDLRAGKMSYLAENLGIALERCVSSANYCKYHQQGLQMARDKYRVDYFHLIYSELLPHHDTHRSYLERLEPYNDDGWLLAILDDTDNRYCIGLDYDKLVQEAVKAKFQYDIPVPGSIKHEKLTSYLTGLDEFALTPEQKSLLFFEGHDDDFEQIRTEQTADDPVNTSSSDPIEMIVCHLREGVISKADGSLYHGKLHESGRSHSPRRRKNISSARKVQLGNEAEDKVYNTLKNSEEYEIGTLFSSHLAKDGGGNDSQGYDMEYRKKGDVLYRYLEIKYYDGDSIILSPNEYHTALRSRDMYDLALVQGNEITLVRAAFADESGYDIRANDYTVRFIVEQENTDVIKL